jgi:arginine decarboxylase
VRLLNRAKERDSSRAIAEICHDDDEPPIVDEAWGAHLPFCEELPSWAMDAGADICVVSVHKMGATFEQGSVLHRSPWPPCDDV